MTNNGLEYVRKNKESKVCIQVQSTIVDALISIQIYIYCTLFFHFSKRKFVMETKNPKDTSNTS